MTGAESSMDELFKSTPRDQARNRVDAAIFHAAIDEFDAAVTDGQLFPRSSSTHRVVDPEAGIRAGRLVRSFATNSIYHHIVRARQQGLSWTRIAAALGIRDMDYPDRWDIYAAWCEAVPDDPGDHLPPETFRWRCLECSEWITEYHPDDTTDGHTPTCSRYCEAP